MAIIDMNNIQWDFQGQLNFLGFLKNSTPILKPKTMAEVIHMSQYENVLWGKYFGRSIFTQSEKLCRTYSVNKYWAQAIFFTPVCYSNKSQFKVILFVRSNFFFCRSHMMIKCFHTSWETSSLFSHYLQNKQAWKANYYLYLFPFGK